MKLISFSGLDGSGKTTQVKLFVNYLKKKNRPYKVVHMIRNSIGNRLLNGLGETEKKKNKSRTKACSWGVLFRKLALIVDLVVFRFYLFFAGKRDLVIVCDRYFYDYLVNIFYLEDKKGAYIAPVLKSLIPKPDLALFLKISPKQADKRKKDQGLDYLDAKQKLYKKFGRRFGFKTIHSREKKTDTAKLIEKQWEKIKG